MNAEAGPVQAAPGCSIDRAARRLGTTALAGIAVFVIAAVALQWLRTDLDWLRAPLSFYLVGPQGGWLVASYFALAIALGALGTSYYLVLAPRARSAAPLLMFALAAIALALTAGAETALPSRPYTLENVVHGVAAGAAFLCVTTAMLLQAWRLRGDPSWRRRFPPAFLLAAACFAALWMDVLMRPQPRGLAQKSLVALIVAWLLLAGWWLRRGGLPMPDPDPARNRP